MHLLGTGIGIFCSDRIVDQSHQNVYLHLVIDVERVLGYQCLLLLLRALLVLQAGCLLASQFEAHLVHEMVEHVLHFHRCKSYVALLAQSQDLLISWVTLALKLRCKGLPTVVWICQRHIQCWFEAANDKTIVSIFASTGDCRIWRCHIDGVGVSIVSKETQAWRKKTTFQSREKRHPIKRQAIGDRSRINNGYLKKLELQTAWQLSLNLWLRPQKNLVSLHPALAHSSAEGLCIHTRIPSIAPA